MKLAALGLALCALASCDAPPVFAGADKRQSTLSSRIEGTAIVNTAARGRVLLFLYDAARPPPPHGTGRPLSFAVLSREAVFGDDDGGAGPFAAPFAFSLVAPGRYLLRGFVDAYDDFVPWYSVSNEANAGDVGGAAVDAATLAARVVEVATDDAGRPLPATGVPVTFSDALIVPSDRPAFEVAEASVTLNGPATVHLAVKSFNDAQVFVPDPVFLASLVDANKDGVPDDSDGDEVPDFWPRVAVRKIAESSSLIDEAIALEAGFDLSSFKAELQVGLGRGEATPKKQLTLIIRPRAFDVSDPAKPVALDAVPSGRYSITVVQSTGQTWRVPNELDPSLAGARGLPPFEPQAFAVVVP